MVTNNFGNSDVDGNDVGDHGDDDQLLVTVMVMTILVTVMLMAMMLVTMVMMTNCW